eukprot:666326-Amphidinium_carterae.1
MTRLKFNYKAAGPCKRLFDMVGLVIFTKSSSPRDLYCDLLYSRGLALANNCVHIPTERVPKRFHYSSTFDLLCFSHAKVGKRSC